MLRLTALIPLSLAPALALTAVACVDSGDEGMYVLNNTAPPDGSCVLSGNPGQPQLGHGIIDYRSPIPYVMTPLLQSRIQMVEGADDSSRTIQLRGADVTLTLKAVTLESGTSFTSTQPNKVYPTFSVLFSGSLPPAGYVNAFVDIIPPATLREIGGMATGDAGLNAEVLAEVVVKGDIGGDAVETAPFYFPVTVCNNCVLNDVGACSEFTGTARTGNACNPYQDGVLDCCTNDSGQRVCPAVMSTPTP